jgi:hypothetical protein
MDHSATYHNKEGFKKNRLRNFGGEFLGSLAGSGEYRQLYTNLEQVQNYLED